VNQRGPRCGDREARDEKVDDVREDEARAPEGGGALGARGIRGRVEEAHGWSPHSAASAP
jgi:hypothetical protein